MTKVPRRLKPRLTLQQVEVIDLGRLAHLEAASYPPDEAATPLELEYRAAVAKDLCYVAFVEGVDAFVGFVVGTAAAEGTERMTKDMLKNHDAFGNVLCIHSVVVEEGRRRQGLGSEMMTAYLSKVRAHTSMRSVLLLAKRANVPFYERLGFSEVGESRISLGASVWIEMRLNL